MTTRYCMLPASAIPVSRDYVRLCRLTDQHCVTVPVAVAHVASNCRGLHSLEEHKIEIMARLASEDCDFIDDSLIALVNCGFLTKETDIPISGVGKGEGVTLPESVTKVAIVTSHRTQSLESAVRSLLGNSQRHNQPMQISIFDDSQMDDAANDNIKMLRGINPPTQSTIRYAGAGDKLRYISALRDESGVDRRVLEFALFGLPFQRITTGANRNAALLDLVDCPFLFIDDDVTAHIACSTLHRAGVRLSSKPRGVRTEYYANIDDVVGSHRFSDQNVLALHSEYLGRSLADSILRSQIGTLDLDCTARLWLAALNNTGNVAATQMGIIGHSGQASPRRLLYSTGQERAYHFSSEDRYHLARTARHVSRMADIFTITESPFCMTYALGLDNTRLLPPFFPIARNSDGVFGVALRMTNPDLYIGHLPYGILHRNLIEHPFSPTLVWESAVQATISEIVILLLQKSLIGNTVLKSDERFRAIGRCLMELGRREVPEFWRVIKDGLQIKYAERIAQLQGLLERFNHQPAFWAADVRMATNNIVEALASRDFGVPRDIVGPDDFRQRISLVRDSIHLYGELMDGWPSIREAAKRLATRDSGFRLSRVI